MLERKRSPSPSDGRGVLEGVKKIISMDTDSLARPNASVAQLLGICNPYL